MRNFKIYFKKITLRFNQVIIICPENNPKSTKEQNESRFPYVITLKKNLFIIYFHIKV